MSFRTSWKNSLRIPTLTKVTMIVVTFQREEIEDNTELRPLMEFVFGPESDEED